MKLPTVQVLITVLSLIFHQMMHILQYLSVLDETITGTSSINDAIITNATIANLSITNCIASLCVTAYLL